MNVCMRIYMCVCVCICVFCNFVAGSLVFVSFSIQIISGFFYITYMLAVSFGHLHNNTSASIFSILKSEERTKSLLAYIILPLVPVLVLFFKVFTPRQRKKIHSVGLWWTNCVVGVVYRGSENKKQQWKMGTAVSFGETINVARGGQKRSRPKAISRPPFLVYVVDVLGFSLCQERPYSNVYGY